MAEIKRADKTIAAICASLKGAKPHIPRICVYGSDGDKGKLYAVMSACNVNYRLYHVMDSDETYDIVLVFVDSVEDWDVVQRAIAFVVDQGAGDVIVVMRMAQNDNEKMRREICAISKTRDIAVRAPVHIRVSTLESLHIPPDPVLVTRFAVSSLPSTTRVTLVANRPSKKRK